MPVTYPGGGVLIPWPSVSAEGNVLATADYDHNFAQASTTCPFTNQQQIFSYKNAEYATATVTMPVLNAADGQAWQFFFDNLYGILNVFQFPSSFCTDPRFSYWSTSDGTNSKVFRMAEPRHSTSIKEGALYYVTFKIRQAT